MKIDMKPYVFEPKIYRLNGRDYEESKCDSYKLYEGEKLLKNAFYEKESYWALLKNGEIVFETTDFNVLRDFFNGRITMRERLLDEISYYYRHVSEHEDFDPNLSTDKSIVDLYNELKDPEQTLARFEGCVYEKNKMNAIDSNKLKWLGSAIANILYSESK